MGLLVQTQFETREGFQVSSVYLRIATVRLVMRTGGTVGVTLLLESHVSEPARRRNATPLPVPFLPSFVVLETTLASGLDFGLFYSTAKASLQAAGFASTDVFESTPEASPQSSESTQTTPPTPPTPSEPVPE